MNRPTCRPSSAATPWMPASTPCTARTPTGSSRRRIITAALSSTVSATLFSAATPTPGNGTDPGAYDTGIAQLTLKRVGGKVTLDSYSFIPCSLSSTVGPDSTVLGPNTLNNYQPSPYTEGGDAWNRAMSMLNGTYEGANYQVDYGNVLTAMNG